MNASDIDTMVLLSSNHAWNIVKFDNGSYYGVDVLWNDDKYNDDNPSNGYFLCSEATLQSGNDVHTSNLAYMSWIPALSETDYAPTVYDMTGSHNGTMDLIAPKNVRIISNNNGKVEFAWDSVNNATEYEFNLYNAKTSSVYVNKSFSNTGVIVVTSLNDDMRAKVRAKTVIGGKPFYSDWSADLVISGHGNNSTPSGSAAISAPKNVKTSAKDTTACLIEWDKVGDAESYKATLFRDSGYKTAWTAGSTSATSIMFTNLTPQRTYYFGIQSVKTVDGKEVLSDFTYISYTVPADTASAEPAKPDAPSNAKAEWKASDTAVVSQNSVPGATGYQLRRFKDPSHKETAQETSHTGTAVNYAGLTAGEKYFDVRAVRSENGKEIYSDWTYFSYTHTAS